MELRFADKDLERLYTDPQFTAKLSQGIVKAFRRLVQYIAQAVDERDFYAMKSLHYEKIERDDRLHSMRFNYQFRLILQIVDQKPGKVVVIQKVEDYH